MDFWWLSLGLGQHFRGTDVAAITGAATEAMALEGPIMDAVFGVKWAGSEGVKAEADVVNSDEEAIGNGFEAVYEPAVIKPLLLPDAIAEPVHEP